MTTFNKKNDPTSTTIWFKENDKHTEGSNLPILKGFVNISREQIEQLLAGEPDEYGCVKLDVALWVGKTEGTLSGKASVQKPRDGQEFRKPTPSKVVIPRPTISPKKVAPVEVNDDSNEDDIPF